MIGLSAALAVDPAGATLASKVHEALYWIEGGILPQGGTD